MGYSRAEWNGLLDQVNTVITDPPEGTDCEPLTPLPLVEEECHRWSKADVQAVHDKLSQTNCSQISFSTIPDLWSQSIIDEITDALALAWCDCEEDQPFCPSAVTTAAFNEICSLGLDSLPQFLTEDQSDLVRWNVRIRVHNCITVVRLLDQNGDPTIFTSATPGDVGIPLSNTPLSPSTNLVVFGSEAPANQFRDKMQALIDENKCATVGKAWISPFGSPLIVSKVQRCFPVPGGGQECIEDELGGGARVFQGPSVTNNLMDMAGCAGGNNFNCPNG